MNQKIKLTLSVLVMGFMLLLVSTAFARGPENAGQMLIYKTSEVLDPIRTLINANNWSYWMKYDGNSGIDPEGNSGGIYPRGSAGVIYEDGFVWGAKVKGKLRVGGQTYRIGTKQMLERIFRIRGDWQKLKEDPAPIRQDAAEFFRIASDDVTDAQMADIVAQYEKDWNEWPVDEGAPYYDVNGDGVYNTADGDYPGLANADQVVWTKVNDADSSRCIDLYGSTPIGMELEITAWAYNQTESQLGQVIFKKYRLTNTSTDTLKDMYVAQWCDPDIGNYTDDLVGCDPALGMGFAYNGGNTDGDFKDLGLAPSAIGFDFFQGPIVDGVAGEDINKNGVDDDLDYAVFDLKKVGPGKVNMPMTSFGYFSAGNTEWDDPDLGIYDGTLQWYNLLRGFITNTNVDAPTPFTHRGSGEVTKFPLDGDPVTGIGDIDGNTALNNFAPADRRMCLNTGPFVMVPNDVQEIVVAIVGGKSGKIETGSRTQSVFDMKINDEIAQFLYSTLFTEVPKPPIPPVVQISPLEKSITLNWGSEPGAIAETEEPVEAGYTFQGYNIYQLPTSTSTMDEAVRVATFDVVDGVKKIIETRFLPQYGQGVNVPVRFGDDTGVQRYIVIDKDYLTGESIFPGNIYYFAVAAYNYNPNAAVVKSLESSLTILPVTTQAKMPGVVDGSVPGDDVSSLTHSAGAAEQISGSITVVDPAQITGHEYKIYFESWHFYMNKDGQWTRTNYPDSVGSGLSKTSDLTGTTMSAIAYTSPNVGTRDLKFILDLVAPDYDYSDGVKLTFPGGIVINSAEDAIGNAHSTYHPIVDKNENTVLWGSPDTTGDGGLSGGEVFTVNINTPTLPMNVDYVVYDDGWSWHYAAVDSQYYRLGNGIVHGGGTCTITEEGYAFKTVNMWGVKDLDADVVVLEGQDKLYNEITVDAPIIDGFQVAVGGSYAAPTDFSSVTYTNLAGEEASATGFNQSKVSSYGYCGWAANGRATEARGLGTTDLTVLIKDYEIRWTGEYEPVTVGGQVIMNVKDGTGSLARLYLARSDDLALHPMNPTPGSADPFMIRVPFEVWNVDDNQQINFDLVDRKQAFSTSDTVWAFNPYDRMYCEFVNTPYKETLYTADDLDQMTWNLVFWEAPYVKGEKLYIKYPNPILLGVDEYTFDTDGLGQTYSANVEKADAKKVTVYPNPYYADNSRANNQFDKYITFYHLPKEATIRIFDLAGHHVEKLEKNDDSQFINWNLENASGLPVASGIYFAHIEMKLSDGSKVTKVLKVFIIQRAQIIKYY